MKTILLGLVLSFSQAPASATAETAKELSGTVTMTKALESSIPAGAVLFVFAKKAGTAAGNGSMPIAVLRVPNPKFPYAFTLGAQNVMAPGTPFEGPFSVYARVSPTGDAMDKSGPQGASSSAKPIKAGAKDIKIELKAN